MPESIVFNMTAGRFHPWLGDSRDGNHIMTFVTTGDAFHFVLRPDQVRELRLAMAALEPEPEPLTLQVETTAGTPIEPLPFSDPPEPHIEVGDTVKFVWGKAPNGTDYDMGEVTLIERGPNGPTGYYVSCRGTIYRRDLAQVFPLNPAADPV